MGSGAFIGKRPAEGFVASSLNLRLQRIRQRLRCIVAPQTPQSLSEIFKSSWRLFAIVHGTKPEPVPPSVADAIP
jgi:hypothetical protein